MAGSKTHLIQNAREMVVSSDLTRIGKLAARAQQNADMAKAVRADFFVPGTIDDFGATNRGAASEVIPSAIVAPSLQGRAGEYNMDIGPGEVEVITNDTADPDVSAYQVACWEGQPITWPSAANPDGSLPRIATICVEPTDEQADEASRNILLDPTTRAYQPQNVYKTSNPSAVFAVVAGTAAAVPFPPTVPTNYVALFDVLMPPRASDSTAFLITRRCWRRIEFPGTSQHGIVKGCVPTWAYGNEATGAVTKLVTGGAVHRFVLDGELITFTAYAYLMPNADTGAGAPGSAPAGNDMPVYLYLCGGRNWPNSVNTYGGWNAASPVRLIESLTPPDCMGYPTAVLGFSGTTIQRNAALYIGVGFKVAGGTINKSLFYDGDWVRPQASTVNICGFKINTGDHFTTGSVTPVSLVVGGIPVPSTVLELQASMYGTAGTYTQTLIVLNAVGGGAVLNVTLAAAAAVATIGGAQSARTKIARPASDTIQYTSTYYTIPSDATVDIRATGYNMNIPRLGS